MKKEYGISDEDLSFRLVPDVGDSGRVNLGLNLSKGNTALTLIPDVERQGMRVKVGVGF